VMLLPDRQPTMKEEEEKELPLHLADHEKAYLERIFLLCSLYVYRYRWPVRRERKEKKGESSRKEKPSPAHSFMLSGDMSLAPLAGKRGRKKKEAYPADPEKPVSFGTTASLSPLCTARSLNATFWRFTRQRGRRRKGRKASPAAKKGGREG